MQLPRISTLGAKSVKDLVSEVNNFISATEKELTDIKYLNSPKNAYNPALHTVYINRKITDYGQRLIKNDAFWFATFKKMIITFRTVGVKTTHATIKVFDQSYIFRSTSNTRLDRFRCEVEVVGRRAIINTVITSKANNVVFNNNTDTLFFTNIIDLKLDSRDSFSIYTDYTNSTPINILLPNSSIESLTIDMLDTNVVN